MAVEKMFKRGYQQQRADLESVKATNANQLSFLFPKVGESNIIFLTEEPLSIGQHTINNNGKYRTTICTETPDCFGCAQESKVSRRSAYLVLDLSPYTYKNAQGVETTVKESVRIYAPAVSFATLLDRISEKKGGISFREMVVYRTGKEANANYSFEPGNEVNVSLKRILKGLTQQLAEELEALVEKEGEEEALYTFLNKQLNQKMVTISLSNNEYDDDSEEVVGAGMLPDDDDDEEDDEDGITTTRLQSRRR